MSLMHKKGMSEKFSAAAISEWSVEAQELFRPRKAEED